ncbi:methyltransferase, FxLD system [Streptomyces spongiicola]|uniref:Protein-L-isoaspartate O-methyltransferase n=1 Tax=Streptomyces spongiicola TaxID=1690221 RepID=A0ABN5KEN4_9ACTN|nr:methyltransferase, FxLD system [Streptomyces spongiicola]AWK08906.1 methyltransferase, FxLD system [Streptomyces spongiicola]
MNTTAQPSPEVLRNQLIDTIVRERVAGLYDPQVEEAMRTVPRHEFLPAVSIETAYTNEAVTIKDNPAEDALPFSCASKPDVVFFMLVQLQAREGHRIFEIGAGTGVNAAYLRRLVGPTGHVITGDIDSDVTAYARKTLDATGYGDIEVITRDGALGAEEYGPFDRIIATVGVWDPSPAMRNQLTPGGRLVLPLRWRGLTRSVALVREPNRHRSDSVKVCGFLPMIEETEEHSGYIDDDHLTRLFWDYDQPIDPTALRAAITQPATLAWSETTVGPVESFDGVWLRMSATDPATCRITVKQPAVDAGLRRPANPNLGPALVEGDSMAYLTLARLPSEEGAVPRFRLGAAAYGPAGETLAERLCTQITAWGDDRTAEPVISLYPAGTPDDQLTDGYVIEKPSTRMVISY